MFTTHVLMDNVLILARVSYKNHLELNTKIQRDAARHLQEEHVARNLRSLSSEPCLK